MTLNAREVRIEEAVPWVRRFAARWITAHGVLGSRVDDVESDCMYVMVMLAAEWHPKHKVPWMKFLGGRIKHRLIDELRRHSGRTTNVSYETTKALQHPVELDDKHGTVDAGYAEVDLRLRLDELLAPYDLRTRQIMRAHVLDDWALAEIGLALDPPLTESRVCQIVNGVRDDVADLRVLAVAVAVAERAA